MVLNRFNDIRDIVVHMGSWYRFGISGFPGALFVY